METEARWTMARCGRTELKKPAWARYVRLSTPITKDLISYEYPGQLMIYESPTGPDYRSVTGAWGGTNRSGIYEYLNPPATEAVSDLNDAPDEQADAAPLKIGETVNGRAHIGTDVDWYKVTAPDDDNTLTFTLTGTPSVDVTVRLYDTSGQEVEAIRTVEGDTSQVTYTATVEPGADYTIEVQQPPHSIVFTFDTSGSMGPYAPLVQQSLRSFAGGVTKGQEFVQVIAFETDPLLDTWTDDSYVVYSAINGYYDQSSSSSAEKGVLDATKLLAGQEGTTAILIITDAETSSFDKTLEMWTAVDAVQPRIFAVHVAGSTTPVLNEHLMEDWSANGGYYQYTISQAEMDRAFDRAATWLRRPAGYSITVASSFEEIATPRPEPTNTPGTDTNRGLDRAGHSQRPARAGIRWRNRVRRGLRPGHDRDHPRHLRLDAGSHAGWPAPDRCRAQCAHRSRHHQIAARGAGHLAHLRLSARLVRYPADRAGATA